MTQSAINRASAAFGKGIETVIHDLTANGCTPDDEVHLIEMMRSIDIMLYGKA